MDGDLGGGAAGLEKVSCVSFVDYQWFSVR